MLRAGDDWALAFFLFGLVGRHRVLPHTHARGTFTTWLGTRSPDVREIIDFAIDWATREEAATPSAHRLHVASPAAAGQIGPAAAIELMQRPYRVLLEDGIRDRDFLLRMCGPHEAAFLLEWMSRDWVEMEHGGGNSRMLQRLSELTRPPRDVRFLSVLFDSEAAAPASPSVESEALRERCVSERIHHHQLQRRAIENYLPRSAFERWVSLGANRAEREARRSRLEKHVHKLSPTERHHLRMKDVSRGFGALYGDDGAMKPADLAAEGGPTELQPFVRTLIASIR